MLRHKDNAVVHHHHDYTDMSGTDYGMMKNIPFPEHMPPGYYRHMPPAHRPPMSPHPVPMPPHPAPKPPKPIDCHCHHGHDGDCPMEHPHNPFEHVPYPPPPQHPSDDYSEERFINSHVCGHHDCNSHGTEPLDWDFGDTTDTEELDDATFTENR